MGPPRTEPDRSSGIDHVARAGVYRHRSEEPESRIKLYAPAVLTSGKRALWPDQRQGRLRHLGRWWPFTSYRTPLFAGSTCGMTATKGDGSFRNYWGRSFWS